MSKETHDMKEERLRWQKSVLESDCAQECITLGMTKDLEVLVYETDETGEPVWAVSTPDGFWLDTKPSKEKALFLCEAIGWKVSTPDNKHKEKTMGTRADFYIGRGDDMEWIGSIAWDGYPDDRDVNAVNKEATEESFREGVSNLIKSSGGIQPHEGWPWPWDDSGTTDYAYAFDAGIVYASHFGGPWFVAAREDWMDDVQAHLPSSFPSESSADGPKLPFPNMRGDKDV